MQLKIIWKDEYIDRLFELQNKGNSGSLIAQKLNEEFSTNFTRGAIIGKMFRLGLTSKTTTVKERIKRTRSQWSVKPEPLAVVKQEPVVLKNVELKPVELPTEPLYIHQMDLDHSFNQCRWPMRNEGCAANTLFCGLPTKVSSFCQQHADVVFTPTYFKRRA